MAGLPQRERQADPAGPQGRGSVDLPARCPAAWAMELVAHKWTIHILFALHAAAAPCRFRHLQRAVAPITQKEQTKQLRNLERSGLVHRKVFAEVPPRVEYWLTELGSTLMPALIGLHEWAERHGPAVAEHWRRGPAGAADHPQDESTFSA